MSLEQYLNELEKQAQDNQRLEDMSIEELAKVAGVKLSMAKCSACGSMYKKGEMTKCSCGAKLAEALPPALAENKEKVKAVQDPKKPGAEVPAELGKTGGVVDYAKRRIAEEKAIAGKTGVPGLIPGREYARVAGGEALKGAKKSVSRGTGGLAGMLMGHMKGRKKFLKKHVKTSSIQKIAYEVTPEDMRGEAMEADPRHMGKMYGTAGAIGGAGAGGLAAIPLARFLPGKAKLLAGLAPVAGGVAGGLLGRRAGEEEALRSATYRRGLGRAAMSAGAQQGYQAGTRAGAVAYHRALQRALARAQAAQQGPVKEGSAASEVTKQVAEKAAPFVSRLHPSIIPGILGAVGGAAVGAAHSDSENRLRNAIAGGITGATLGATGGAVAREFGLGRQAAKSLAVADEQVMKGLEDAFYKGMSTGMATGGQQGAEAVLKLLGTTADKAKKVSGSSWRRGLARLAGL